MDSPFEFGKSQIFLGKLEREIGTIALYMEKRGDPGTGIVVEEDSSAKGNECRTKFGFRVEFILPVLPDDDQVTKYLEKGELSKDENLWYYDNKQVSEAGSLHRSFVNFFEENKGITKDACFIVALKKAQDNQKPRIMIIGPTGETITDNLNVPRKIVPAGDIKVSFNSISIDVDYKTDFKNGNVMNHIEVVYKQFSDDSSFPTVNKLVPISADGKTRVILDKLKPGSNYDIKSRFVSKLNFKQWAVGPWSDALTVTTAFSSPPSSPTVQQKGKGYLKFRVKYRETSINPFF